MSVALRATSPMSAAPMPPRWRAGETHSGPNVRISCSVPPSETILPRSHMTWPTSLPSASATRLRSGMKEASVRTRWMMKGFLGAGLREVPEGVEGELLGGGVVGAPFLTNDHGFNLDGMSQPGFPCMNQTPPTADSPTGSARASRSSRKQNARSSCSQLAPSRGKGIAPTDLCR